MRLRVVTPLRVSGVNSSGWAKLLVMIETAMDPFAAEVPEGTINRANGREPIHPNHPGICSLDQMHNSE